MRFSALVLSAVVVASFGVLSVSADSAKANVTQLACANAQIPGLVENLTIKGSGLTAIVHLDDDSMAGDLTYNAAITQELANEPTFPKGTLAIEGQMTIKAPSSPGQLQGIFFVDASVLDGKPGQLMRMGGDMLLKFDCK